MTYFEPIELETTAAVLALRVTNILVTFGRRSTTRCSVVVTDGLVTHRWSEYVDEGELDVNDRFDNGGGNARSGIGCTGWRAPGGLARAPRRGPWPAPSHRRPLPRPSD